MPANAVARVGQTSLLGSMHLELAPPLGQGPRGTLPTTRRFRWTEPLPTRPPNRPSLPSRRSSTTVDWDRSDGIIHNFNAALTGRQQDIRQLLERLDTFVGTLDDQRDNIIDAITELNRLRQRPQPTSKEISPAPCRQSRRLSRSWSANNPG